MDHINESYAYIEFTIYYRSIPIDFNQRVPKDNPLEKAFHHAPTVVDVHNDFI